MSAERSNPAQAAGAQLHPLSVEDRVDLGKRGGRDDRLVGSLGWDRQDPFDVGGVFGVKTLRLLRDVGPGHPGLSSHRYQSLTGPSGEEVWESYVENKTPSAWRLWWVYGPGADTLTIVTVGPHP